MVTSSAVTQQLAPQVAVSSSPYLNAFAIKDPSTMAWPVRVLKVTLKRNETQTHEDLGKLRSIIWDLRKQYASDCKGYGFVVDAAKSSVAIPQKWMLKLPIDTPEFKVELEKELLADPSTAMGSRIVCGIIKDAIKRHFKNQTSSELGPLWQDYSGFAQVPKPSNEFLMCRKFSLQLKELAHEQIVLQCNVSTLTIDNLTIADYYQRGTVLELAEMIELKRHGRSNRDNRPVSIRGIQQLPTGVTVAVEIEDVDLLVRDSKLSVAEQIALAPSKQIRCSVFPLPAAPVPCGEVRLLLDSQITGEDHADTILEPRERFEFAIKVRNFIHGIDVFGKTLMFEDAAFQIASSDLIEVLPPRIRVCGGPNEELTIPSPQKFDRSHLEQRVRRRAECIRKNGFLFRRPISPVLAVPEAFGQACGTRLKLDLETIWREQNIEADFVLCLYRRVEEIHEFVQEGGYNAVFAVLPKDFDESANNESTYERLKKRIEVPSQCIQHNHILPPRFNKTAKDELYHREPKVARRVYPKYQLCLANLLVKHNWFPFAPCDPFNYNVQIGIDVGGVHNSDVMSCLGYGFRNPRRGIFFLPDEIPVPFAKKEPIPTTALYRGLLAQFEKAHSELTALKFAVDFSTAIFYRDGQLLGDGDEWNELSAFQQLHQELRTRGWVPDGSTWTAIA